MKSKKEYNKEYYLKNREWKKKYYLKNKEQIIERSRKYYLKNKEQIIERNKEHYLKNRERRMGEMKDYRLKNKKQIKEYLSKLENIERRRNRVNNKYQTDINYRLVCLCRNRIYHALKYNSKSASTMKLIGCTPDELRRRIESLFKPWMTWENHGLWDVDHIKACANFDLTDPAQQRICFHYTNLQPLEHIANIKKGAG
jgi:hypothetical protein|tara:strand:- start:42 stop:638 length:597 start_codon:yes stop_codon:yes gene_type:complete